LRSAKSQWRTALSSLLREHPDLKTRRSEP